MSDKFFQPGDLVSITVWDNIWDEDAEDTDQVEDELTIGVLLYERNYLGMDAYQVLFQDRRGVQSDWIQTTNSLENGRSDERRRSKARCSFFRSIDRNVALRSCSSTQCATSVDETCSFDLERDPPARSRECEREGSDVADSESLDIQEHFCEEVVDRASGREDPKFEGMRADDEDTSNETNRQ